MATGVLISSFTYVGVPPLSAVFGFFKTSSGVQIQRIQISAQTPPVGGNITVQLVDEAGNAYVGATVALPSGSPYYDQPLAAPISLGLAKIVRAQITGVDLGVASDLTVNLIGATAQGTTPPSGCGPSNCQPPQAQLLFFQGNVQQQVAEAAAEAAAAAASATAANDSAVAAASSASAAAGSANAAAASDTNAAAQVVLAAGYATNANNAAAAANTYAGQAATSATNAATSAAEAAASAAAANTRAAATIGLTVGATHTIPDAAETVVNWDGANFDDAAFWNSGAPSRITVPADVTRVRLSAGIRWPSAATGSRKITIKKNGGEAWATCDLSSVDTGNGTILTPIIEVIPGDYFEVYVEQDSGGPLDLETSTVNANRSNFFCVEVMGQS